MTDPCAMLPWDCRFFGFNIARATADTMTNDLARRIEAWSLAADVRCVYFFGRADDPETVRSAEAAGWRQMDVRITFEQPLSRAPIPLGRGLRDAAPGDLESLVTLARQSHTDTRYYFDPLFARSKAAELYDVWIRNSVAGYARRVMVAGGAGEVEGYVTCHLEQDTASIGLIAVRPDCRGRGIGANLVRGAADWLASLGAVRLRVATSARNLSAQRLYQRCGLVTQAVELIYHRWFGGPVS